MGEVSFMLTCVCWLLLISMSSFLFVIQRILFGESNVAPHRFLFSILAPFLITVYGYKRKSLSISGSLTAIWMGIILTLGHVSFFMSLLFFFVSGSKFTKYKHQEKRKIEGDNFKEGGQRNWVQVLCNGGVPLELGLLYLLDVGCAVDYPVDFSRNYRASWISCALMGAIACSNGDTWSSELGSVLGSDPRLITTMNKVPRGTNGAVSFLGTIVSFFGGGFVGLGYFLGVYFSSTRRMYSTSPNQMSIILVGALAGLFGSLVDSLLGATLQYSAITTKGAIVESPEPKAKHISGFQILDNHAVNLLAAIITASITPKIAMQFF